MGTHSPRNMNGEKPKPPEGCVTRAAAGLVSSALVGGLVGAVEAMWTDAPAVKAEKTWPAIRATWACVARNSALFGMIGGVYMGGECAAESIRMKTDFWNGVYGGFAAGQILAFKTASPLRGVAAGLCFASISAFVDLNGQRLQPERFTDPEKTFTY